MSVQITRQMTNSGNVQVRIKLQPSFKVKESYLTSVRAALYPCNNPKLWPLKWPHVRPEQWWASLTSTGCSSPYVPHFIFITHHIKKNPYHFSFPVHGGNYPNVDCTNPIFKTVLIILVLLKVVQEQLLYAKTCMIRVKDKHWNAINKLRHLWNQRQVKVSQLTWGGGEICRIWEWQLKAASGDHTGSILEL